MSCRYCTEAKSNPTRDGFAKGCRSCEARALASIGAHIESQDLGVITPHYRATLERVFGAEWKQGGELVKTWGQCITAASTRTKARATASAPAGRA